MQSVDVETGEVLALVTDAEFQSLIPPLSEEEYAQLEENLLVDGCRDALVVWNDTLIDGHNRYRICRQYGIPFKTAEQAFESRADAIAWIVDNQLGRRNLELFVRGELVLKKKTALAAKAKANQLSGLKRGDHSPVLANLPKRAVNTREELAADAGISSRTLAKIEQIVASAPEPIKAAARSGDLSVDRAYRLTKALEAAPGDVGAVVVRYGVENPDLVPFLAHCSASKLDTWRVITETGTLDGERPIDLVSKTEADAYLEQLAYEHRQQAQEDKRHQKARAIAALAARTGELDPQRLGRFPVIYADPPWQYEHVKTSSRAVENHYPTLSLGEICALPVHRLATDDAVLFLWATSPKLFEAMTVLHCWGFTYRTCMVWVKDRIGMGDYVRQRHELLLIGRRGSIPVPLPENRSDYSTPVPIGVLLAAVAQASVVTIEPSLDDIPF